MGYFTDYTLFVKKNNTNISNMSIYRDVKDKLGQMYDLQNILQYNNINAKWYDYDAEMAYISTLFPGFKFELHGLGEDSMDMWEKTYKNGELIGYYKCDMINMMKTQIKKMQAQKSFYEDSFDSSHELYYLLKCNSYKDEPIECMRNVSLIGDSLLERWLRKHDYK